MTTVEKKSFEKRYKTVVPVLRPDGVEPLAELGADGEHQDYAIARWLGRESFETLIADERLELVEYSERLIPLDEVDPRLSDMLGRPVADFEWFELSAIGRLNQAMFDWHAAEIVWKTEQWLDAELAWKLAEASQDEDEDED